MARIDWGQIKVEKVKAAVDWSKIGVKEVKTTRDWESLRSPSTIMTDDDLVKTVPLQDLARISTVIPPTTGVEPVYLDLSTQIAAGIATPYAKIIEEPAWQLTSGILQGVSASVKFFDRLIPEGVRSEATKKNVKWLDKMADYYGQPQKYAPVAKEVAWARRQERADAAQKGTASLILNDLGAAATDLASLMAQFAMMNFAAPVMGSTSLSSIGSRLTKMGIHGLLTSPGTLDERVEAATYRIAYNITPYLANATGATGLASVTTDALLNMFLSIPTYTRAYKEAGGLTKEFLIMALPTFVMDLGLALKTRGKPENIMRAQIRRYNKGRIKSLAVPDGELYQMVKDMQNKIRLDEGKSDYQLKKEIRELKGRLVEEGVKVRKKMLDDPLKTGELIERGTPEAINTPKTPLRDPPKQTDQSPGFRPDESLPLRGGLSDISAIKKAAYDLYKVIDVEARFKAVNAPETGFHVKNYFSMRGAIEGMGHHLVRKLTTTHKLTKSEWADVTYYASQPGLLKGLDAKRYPVFAKAAREVNEAFLTIERRLKEAKIIVDPWPQSQINRLQEDIIHNREVIKTVEKSGMPEQLRKYRLDKLNAEMVEAQGAINFLKAEDIQYVHIPTRLWMAKLMKENPDKARTIMNRYFRERTTVDIKELAERLKKGGVITDEDIDIRNILAAYHQQAGHKIALSNILNAAEREGLIVDADKQKNWPRFNPRWAPELRGKRVHPAFEQFVNEFTLKSEAIPLHRVLSYFKMTQFDSPLFMPFYDLYQAFWLGSMRSVKTPLYAWRAFKSMLDKDEAHMKLAENGLFSRPFVAPFEDFMKSIDIAKAGNNFVGQAISFLKGEWQGVKEAHPLIKPFRIASIPIDAIYKPIWHIAWGGDQLIRLMSGHYLLDKGYTYRESAQIAAKFHADYASVPPTLKNKLNKVFFTPIFPIVMGKLQTEMIYQSGKLLTDAVRLKEPDEKTKAMVGGLMGLIGLAVLQDTILKQLGYERDTFGYRYTKKVIDEEGNEKELVISTPNPGNVLLRYAKGFGNWPHTPEEFGRYVTRVSWRLHPVWRLAIRLGANLSDDGKTPIYNKWGDPLTISEDIVSYSAGSLIRIIRRIDELPSSESDKRAAWEALQDDVGVLWTTFLKPATQVYLRESKDKRKRGRMIGIMRSFAEFSSKRPYRSDEEARRATLRFERELKEMMEMQ